MRRNIFWPLMLAMALVLSHPLAAAEQTGPPESYKSFYSDALQIEMKYRIFLPPGYDKTDKKYPVAYLLHGYNFTRNIENPPADAVFEEENHWMDQENLAEIATCMMTVDSYKALADCLDRNQVPKWQGVMAAMETEYPNPSLPIEPMIIVMPDGNNGFYVDREDKMPTYPPAGPGFPAFADGFGAGSTGMYETYIVRDLVNHIDKTLRTIPDRNARYLGGFSMGGLGTADLLLRHPDIFSAGAALSITFDFQSWMNDKFAIQLMSKTTPEIVAVFFDKSGKKPNADFIKEYDPINLVSKLTRTDIVFYFDAGGGDPYAGRDQFKSFDKLQKALADKGIEALPQVHIIQPTEFNGKGQHNKDYWRSRLGVMLTLFSNKARESVENK